MAIKFVDEEPEEPGAKPVPRKPNPEPSAEAVQPDPPGGMPGGQLPFAKSEPRSRGRKKPLR